MALVAETQLTRMKEGVKTFLFGLDRKQGPRQIGGGRSGGPELTTLFFIPDTRGLPCTTEVPVSVYMILSKTEDGYQSSKRVYIHGDRQVGIVTPLTDNDICIVVPVGQVTKNTVGVFGVSVVEGDYPVLPMQ